LNYYSLKHFITR